MSLVLAIVFIVLLAIAAVSDLLTMTIPNRISIGLVIAYIVLAPFCGMHWPEIGLSLLAALIVFVGCFALFAAHVMGGGDAKLLTACALWFGFNPSLISFLVNTAVMGGVVTLVILLIRWQAPALLAMGAKLPNSLVSAGKIPYGIAIALGGALSLQHAPIFAALG